MKFTKILATILVHGLLASGLVSAGVVVPRAGRGSPGRPNRTPSPTRPNRPAVPAPPAAPAAPPVLPLLPNAVAVMDQGIKRAAVNQGVDTQGLATCISISAIGVPSRAGGPNKAMIHIGALGNPQGSVERFFKDVGALGFKRGTSRITVSAPKETYVQFAYINDPDFKRVADLGESRSPGFLKRTQDTLNKLVNDATIEGKKFTRSNGGVFAQFDREDPVNIILLPNRDSSHVLTASGKESVGGKVIYDKY